MFSMIALGSYLTLFRLSYATLPSSLPTSSPTSAEISFISCNNSNSDSIYKDHSWFLSPYYLEEIMNRKPMIIENSSRKLYAMDDPEWIPVNYTYYIQYPYDVELCERYAEDSDLKDFLVYKDDAPFTPESSTLPRTELRMEDCQMNTGVYRFTGNFMVDCNTTGVTIFQIFDENVGPQFMLRINKGYVEILSGVEGTPKYSYQCGIYYSLDVRFDADAISYCAFINDDPFYQFTNETSNDGKLKFYFKAGAYSASTASERMEIFYKDIKAYKYNDALNSTDGMCV